MQREGSFALFRVSNMRRCSILWRHVVNKVACTSLQIVNKYKQKDPFSNTYLTVLHVFHFKKSCTITKAYNQPPQNMVCERARTYSSRRKKAKATCRINILYQWILPKSSNNSGTCCSYSKTGRLLFLV